MVTVNNKTFFLSKDVKVFPCTYRGYTGTQVVPVDPEARAVTEYNYTNLRSRIGSHDSYVISYNSGVLNCIIGGYYFELTIDSTTAAEIGTNRLVIKLEEKTLLANNISTRKTKVLGQLLGQNATDCLDTYVPENSLLIFVGLAVVGDEVSSSDYTYSLQPFADDKGTIKADSQILNDVLITDSGFGAVRQYQKYETNQERNKATGIRATALGYGTEASGNYAFASGKQTKASGQNSAAFGVGTEAENDNQIVIGSYNDTTDEGNKDKIFVIGGGTAADERSNIFTVDTSGNTEMTGNLKMKNATISNGTIVCEPADTVADLLKINDDFVVTKTKITSNATDYTLGKDGTIAAIDKTNASFAVPLSAPSIVSSGNVSVGGNFSVAKVEKTSTTNLFTVASEETTITTDFKLDGNAALNKDVAINGGLAVSNAITANSTLTVEKATTLNGKLSVTSGGCDITGNTAITGNIAVKGTAKNTTFSIDSKTGNITAGQTIALNGAAVSYASDVFNFGTKAINTTGTLTAASLTATDTITGKDFKAADMFETDSTNAKIYFGAKTEGKAPILFNTSTGDVNVTNDFTAKNIEAESMTVNNPAFTISNVFTIKATNDIAQTDIKTNTAITGNLTVSDSTNITGNLEASKVNTTELLVTGNITSTGEITANSFNATSDARKKQNIVDYICNKSILDLPIKKYEYINDKNHIEHIGCLAQDLQEICPELVHEDSEGYLAIEESKLIYLLIKEVKELKAKLIKE